MTSNSGLIRHVKKGEYILRQGEHGEVAYIIDQGHVEIIIEDSAGQKQRFIQGPGSLFGEVALLADTKRAASVVALEDCDLITLTQDDLNKRINAADPVLKLVTQNLINYCRNSLSKLNKVDADLLRTLEKDSTNENNIETQDESSQAPEENNSLVSSMKMEYSLKKALENDELVLHYQPIIDLKTLQTCGFEALMRWNHPTDGLIYPNDFIPVAEDTGLIEELSIWALTESTNALKRFETLPNAPQNPYISVNFSSHDISKPTFLTELVEAVSHANLTPKQIKIEITERLLILKPRLAAQTLKQCKEAGFSIAIDDFGTGYSSLSYLQDFPIDTLKIDQAFVHKMVGDTTSEELVRTIIHLGKTLDMDIIAEGAETREQVQKLIELDCEMAQGYYFEKALSEDEIVSTFRKWDIT